MKKLGWTLGASALAFAATCLFNEPVYAENLPQKDTKISDTNQDIIEKGRWEELKGQIKEQWGKLTDDDLKEAEGNLQKLRGILQQKYGYEKDRVEKEVREFAEKNGLISKK